MGNRIRLTAATCKEKKRGWATVLWCDSEKDRRSFQLITESPASLYILHDRDRKFDCGDGIHSDGDNLQKSHWHIVFRFENARYGSSICEEFDIEPYRLEVLLGEKGMLKYLLHVDHSEKYQYSIDDVHGNDALKQKLVRLLDSIGKSEEKRVEEILDYIDNYQGILKMKDLTRHCCSIGKWRILRSSQYLFNRILTEHNALYE